MPSGQLPSADSDYQTDGDGFSLSIPVWNTLFASISQRLKDLEAVQADFDALIAAGTSDAITVITDQVAPQMTAIQATIDAANADLTQALELLANLQANGVDASKVELVAIAGLAALDAQAAFAELKGVTDTIVSTDIPAAIATRISAADKASETEAEAGVNDTKFMTPLSTKQAIAAQSSDAVTETFTTSGTFTKEDDDFAYMIELWAGGGGGANSPSNGTAVYGGGGGEYSSRLIPAFLIGATETVTIGAGGLGSPFGANQTGGTNGGNSSFGSFLSARGGFSATAPSNQGVAGGGQRPVQLSGGQTATSGFASGSAGGLYTAGVAGGLSTMGGGGGGSVYVSSAGLGGTSMAGGSGGAGNITAVVKGGNGSPRGGGGGASSGDGGGGDGGRGEARITRFKRFKSA
jgi:hypothetical protein